jgi:GGDEF domain-containing protein
MSPEELRQALLVSEKTGLPNRRAFDERDEPESSPWVAMCDVNGLKALNDGFGYSAGDILIRRLAEGLVGLAWTPITTRETSSCAEATHTKS